MGDDRILDPLCNLQLWSWPWTFKVKLWNGCILRMGGPIYMEWILSIGCWTHYVTLTFNLTHELGLLFSRITFQIAISYRWWAHYETLDLQYGLAHGLMIISNILATNGLMQNCYSFQPAGPLMSCPFFDQWTEGCCHSLNVLFNSPALNLFRKQKYIFVFLIVSRHWDGQLYDYSSVVLNNIWPCVHNYASLYIYIS